MCYFSIISSIPCIRNSCVTPKDPKQLKTSCIRKKCNVTIALSRPALDCTCSYALADNCSPANSCLSVNKLQIKSVLYKKICETPLNYKVKQSHTALSNPCFSHSKTQMLTASRKFPTYLTWVSEQHKRWSQPLYHLKAINFPWIVVLWLTTTLIQLHHCIQGHMWQSWRTVGEIKFAHTWFVFEQKLGWSQLVWQ